MSDHDPSSDPPTGDAAEGYDEYFIPRFEPWVTDAIAALGAPTPLAADGSIAVPCCGPGRELQLLAPALPDRTIVGVDVSAEMCSRARRRCRGYANVRVEHADATALSAHWANRAGAVLSCFGLQSVEAPDAALADWTRCLTQSGRIVVVFWPPHIEAEGPFALLRTLLDTELGARDPTWQERLVSAIENAGAKVLDDRSISHTMTHPSAAAFFDAFAHSGPGRAVAMRHGFDVMDRLRASFLERAPAGPFEHEPTARLLAAQRG